MNNNNNKDNWQEREIGALWRVNGAKKSFYSGELVDKQSGSRKKIVVFINQNKDKESNQPDLRIYESKEQ